jgi:hypothetical protein
MEQNKILEQELDRLLDIFAITGFSHNSRENAIKKLAQFIRDREARQGMKWVATDCETFPPDEAHCFFYLHKFKSIQYGRFFLKDTFGRERIFISEQGAHFQMGEVSHFMVFQPAAPGDESPSTTVDAEKLWEQWAISDGIEYMPKSRFIKAIQSIQQ